MNQFFAGYSIHGFDPLIELISLPGIGGMLPAGLRVDMTKADKAAGCTTVRLPLGLLEQERLLPVGAKAVKVRLSWRIQGRTDAAEALPAVKVAASEQGPIDAEGQQKLWTYYGRNVFLGENEEIEGVIDLPILVRSPARTLEASQDVVYGPLVYIPVGWILELHSYAVDQIEPAEVPPVPQGETERFVAWYRRNGVKGATLDLRWRSPKGGVEHP